MSKAKVESFGWEELNKQTDRCVIICLMMRPGTRLFSAKLEYDHYPPRTEKNKDYQYAIGKWEEMTFIAVSLPKDDKHLADAVAASLGMRLEEEQMMLLFSGAGGPKTFPAQGPHIFHLSGEYTGDEEAELRTVFDSDLPERKAYVMRNARIALTPPGWLDDFMADMTKYVTGTPKFVQRAVETRPQIWETLVAHLDDEMLGLITICKDQMGAPYVGIIYTHPEVRHYGVAGFLLRAAITFCVREKAGRLNIRSNHAYINKILSHWPEEANAAAQWEIIGDELSVEQEKAEVAKSCMED